jgi:hypothetical protein
LNEIKRRKEIVMDQERAKVSRKSSNEDEEG